MRESRSAGRRRLAASAAEASFLSGRFTFFDLRLSKPAHRYYRDALSMAEEADDDLLAAAIFGHIAFVAGFAGRRAEAEACFASARARAGRRCTRLMAAWLASAAAEVASVNHEAPQSLLALAQAESALDRSNSQDEPEWLDWFSPGQFDSFKGYCLLKANQPRQARRSLDAALRGLAGPEDAKQQGVVLADLADTQILVGNLDEACDFLSRAVTVTRETGYVTALDRIRSARLRLSSWNGERAVKDLDETLSNFLSHGHGRAHLR
jgi:tetratricopeptide (TPR) repeat protein